LHAKLPITPNVRMESMETVFEYSLYAGLVIAAIATLWLLATAYHQSWKCGLLVTFVPVLLPWHIFRGQPRTAAPAALLAVGIALLAFPPLYTRFMPIDLGERVTTVDGEKHVTLTGWNKNDYRAITRHPDCSVLQMANSDVTDSTLEFVEALPKLRELDLDNTQITDSGLKIIAALHELQRLRISRTRVTDAGFQESLAKHPKLRQLWCPDTAIKRSSLEAWKQAGESRRFIGGLE
jgi:hypothetical protein